MASGRSPPTGKGHEAQRTPDANAAQWAGLKIAVNEEMKCPICRCMLLAPHIVIPCGHVYCSHCISKWLHDFGKSTCPECRVKVMGPPLPCRMLDKVSDLMARDPVNLQDAKERANRKGKSEDAAATFRQRWEMDMQHPHGPAPNVWPSNIVPSEPWHLAAAVQQSRLARVPYGIAGFHRGNNFVPWVERDPSILAAADAITRARPQHVPPAETNEGTFQPMSDSAGPAMGGPTLVQTTHGVSLVPGGALPAVDAISDDERFSRAVLRARNTARSLHRLNDNSFVRTPPATQESRMITSNQQNSEVVDTPRTRPTPHDPPGFRQCPSRDHTGGGL